MNREKFLAEVDRVFQILFLQKLITMILRAAWLGGATYLLCWGANQMRGWFPHSERWVWAAGVVFVLVLASVILKRKATRRFAWRLDQAFGLSEQFYTAYEGITKPATQEGTEIGMEFLLESEAIARLPEIRKQIADRGWQLRREIGATVIVLIQLLFVYVGSVYGIDRIDRQDLSGSLPPLGREPSAGEVLAYLSTEGGNTGGARVTSLGERVSLGERCELDFSVEQWDRLGIVFEQLGRQLTEEALTFALGRAILDEAYAPAANQFEKLADTAGDLSEDTRQGLTDQFLAVSVGLQQAGMGSAAAPFSEATGALLDGPPAAVSVEFDALAVLMQQIAACNGLGGSSLQVVLPFDLAASPGDSTDFPIAESGQMPAGGTLFQVEDQEGYTGGSGTGKWQFTNVLLEDYDLVEAYFPPR